MIAAEPKVLVQGISRGDGAKGTEQMIVRGTSVVAGCTAGEAGREVAGVPMYDTVSEALEVHPIDVSVIFEPAPLAKAAAIEAIQAGVPTVIMLAESVPIHDTLEILALARRAEARLIGPSSPGIALPGRDFVAIVPASVPGQFVRGRIGVVSRSAGVATQINLDLVARGYGQSAFIGLGSDPIVGTTFVDALEWFESDPNTDAVVLLGEDGGPMEKEAAAFIPSMTKPVVAFVAGHAAAADETVSHGTAMVAGGNGTASSKIEALAEAGALVAIVPSDVIELLDSVRSA